jgi:hypothetical protein
MHSVLNICYRTLAKTFVSWILCLEKKESDNKIFKKMYSLIFYIVGLDVSESQLEQGSLILQFYCTLFFLSVGVKICFTYIAAGRPVADFIRDSR